MYNIALLVDPYRGVFEVVDTADDLLEAWRRAGTARRKQQGIYVVLSNETREDPKPVNRKARSGVPVERTGRDC